MSDIEGAEQDLKASIDIVPSFTQSWVKIASVYMEQSNPQKTFECFEEAIKHNPEDPDIYYHRGQGTFFLAEQVGTGANVENTNYALCCSLVYHEPVP